MATIRERYVAVAASVALAGSIGIAASANVAAAAPSIAPSVAAASAPSAKRLTTKKVNYCSTLTKKQRTTLKKQLRVKRLTNKQCSAKAYEPGRGWASSPVCCSVDTCPATAEGRAHGPGRADPLSG